MYHDIAYSRTKNPADRLKADQELIDFAKKRMRSLDANISERIASELVSSLLTAKRKIGGMGLMRKKKHKKVSVRRKEKLVDF